MANPNPRRPDRFGGLGSAPDRINTALAFFAILAVVVPILLGYAAVSKRMRDGQDYTGWVFGCLAITFFVWALVVRRRKHILTSLLFGLVVLFVIAESGPLAELRGVAAQSAGNAQDWAFDNLFTSEGLREMGRSAGNFAEKAFVVILKIAGVLLFVGVAAGLWAESIYQNLVQNAATGRPVGSLDFEDLYVDELYSSLVISIAVVFFSLVTSISVIGLLLGTGWNPGWLGVFVSLVLAVLAVLILAFVNFVISVQALVPESTTGLEKLQEEREKREGEGKGLVGLAISFHKRVAKFLEDNRTKVVQNAAKPPESDGNAEASKAPVDQPTPKSSTE